jgi:hypothetical protein
MLDPEIPASGHFWQVQWQVALLLGRPNLNEPTSSGHSPQVQPLWLANSSPPSRQP